MTSIDLAAAAEFMATHARMLDRRRFDHADPTAALAAYRNADGGYGWGLEPDLRAPESQPGAALHAFEVFAEVGGAPEAVALCDWLDSVTLPDGGLPMALPMSTTAGSGPWWAAADPSESSLQITSISAANAHRVAGPRERTRGSSGRRATASTRSTRWTRRRSRSSSASACGSSTPCTTARPRRRGCCASSATRSRPTA